MNHLTHATRPSTTRIHADHVARMAAHQARLAGDDIARCAQVYIDAYAAALLEDASA
jgi:hypothetical protein